MLRAFLLSSAQLGDPAIAGVFVTSVAVTLLLLAMLGTFAFSGWLLGRDLAQMVAARHVDAAAMRGWRASGGWQRFALGVAGTALFMVPVLNLAAPVPAAAMATHLFHGRRRI